MTRVMIMAGGTGGHVFPALAVADELKQRDVAISWMGTAKGIEARLVPEAGYVLSEIKVQGLRGNGALGWLLAPFKVLAAVWQAMTVLRETKPDVVMGLGGFASGPGGVAAWLLRKPLVIHEQNAIPGLTNTLLAKLANRILTGFPNSFADKIGAEWVGNPVRKQIEDLPMPHLRQSQEHGAMKLLVLGGSLGAQSLNEQIPAALALLSTSQRPDVRHQCGSRHIESCRNSYKAADVAADVTDFIADMADAYAWADLVICRAGALTVAELSAAGVASILVPYPHAVDDHQTHNASLLVEANAAELIADKDLDATLLASKISHFEQDRDTLLNMANEARQVAKIGTATQIADICMELSHG
ncbi:undecaprenyldiphospho-muramoylpentapeptide beta-N-acetylglucosaminyltransferase [Methylophaga thiooxydans]|uniref:undecaprenyldiphospho-muramoylpentapeptide beta-N-acetylglucosaminyltransferase n=1 Tax=Methylophaga thiooxydans TaxID=392484 RepID=UPI002355EDA0|nr:undecaprenyldiphospho-muramoylpentapeptide beta-N-acetylglucosaminyltransferase [Methylophaga thiooxydans]